jgi:uncharacterized protein YggU (UPF0235/DUF167 family)
VAAVCRQFAQAPRRLEPLGFHATEALLKRSRAVTIRVNVRPDSRMRAFEPATEGTWIARLRSASGDGKANDGLITPIAARLQCRKSALSIKAGAAGRRRNSGWRSCVTMRLEEVRRWCG